MKELHNVQAEEAALGSLLVDPSAISKVAYFLRPEDFWNRRNRVLYEAILALHDDGEDVDPVTISDYMERTLDEDRTLILADVSDLLIKTPTAMHAESYARIVARRSVDRKLQDAASEIAKVAYSDQDVEEKLVAAQEALEAVEIVGARPEAMDAAQAAQVLGDLAAVYAADPLKSDSDVRGYSMGVADLDRMLRGWKSGLYLIGGVTHVGKTAFVSQLAMNVAQQGGSVLFIETEDTVEQMWSRFFALLSGYDLDSLERGLNDQQLAEYRQAMETAKGWDMEIIAKAVSVPQVALEVKSRRLDLVVVDNLETPSMAYKGDGEWQKFRAAAYGLLSVAQENGVPLMTTMQVSKHKLESRKNKVPQMEDLYGADGPAQAASVVLTLHRDDVWNIGWGKPDHKMRVTCFKDKLSHKGAGQYKTLQFGQQGQVRDMYVSDGLDDYEEVVGYDPEDDPIEF